MAYLIESRRVDPATGREATYFRIGERTAGRQRTFAIGFMAKAEAKRLLKIHEGQVAAGAGLQTAEPPSRRRLAAYLDERLLPRVRAAGLARKSVVSCEGSCAHLRRLLGEFVVAGLEAGDADRYIELRRGEGVRARTIQIELGWLVRALQLAVEDGLLARVPKIARPPNTDKKPHVFLDVAQSTRLLAVLPWADEPASALAIYATLELGLRCGELLSRRWEDIRWGQGSSGALFVGPRVEDGELTWTTKTKKARTVPLTPGLRRHLEERWLGVGRPEEGWVFPNRDNPAHCMTTFRGTLRSSCRLAGVPELHPHALRHTWATRLAVKGIPKAVTMALGGWTSPRVLEEVYQHSVTELESDALRLAALPDPDQNRLGTTRPGGRVLPISATHPNRRGR